MAPVPKVSDFASFQQSTLSSASEKAKCIWYIPSKARTCKCDVYQDDTAKAFELGTTISQSNPDQAQLNQFLEYARLRCCNSGKHRLKLDESELLLPLARRWLSEFAQTNPLASESVSTVASPSPNTMPETEIQTTRQHRIIQTRSCSQQSSQVEQSSTNSSTPEEPPSSPFRPRIILESQSVSDKLLTPLAKKTAPGTIYLYTRLSSLDHTKIGFTECSAEQRLKKWSKLCGYTPILLADFRDVPHARKVETLIHFQLANQWRVERYCAGCGTQHREWFEIESVEAIAVAGQWARWMKEAEPYAEDRWLKEVWRRELQTLEKNGIAVTAERLLRIHEESLGQYVAPNSAVIEETEEAIEDENPSTNALSVPEVSTDRRTMGPDVQASVPQRSAQPQPPTPLSPTDIQLLAEYVSSVLAALKVHVQVSHQSTAVLLASTAEASRRASELGMKLDPTLSLGSQPSMVSVASG